MRKKWVGFAVIFFLAVVTVAPLRRVAEGTCALVRGFGRKNPLFRCQGWIWRFPGIVKVEMYPQRDGVAVVAGLSELATREGAKLHARWQLTALPGECPGWPQRGEEGVGVAAREIGEAILVEDPAWIESGEARTLQKGRFPSPARLPACVASMTITPELTPEVRRAIALTQLRKQMRVPPNPVVVVGWDGADWELLDFLLKKGKLPNLQRLLARGTGAELEPLRPLVSPLIWTSIATGVRPEKHGIFDFLRASSSGKLEPVTALDRRAPAVWDIFSNLGITVGVVGWWATWPAQPVKGFMISDRVAYQLTPVDTRASGLVYPPELEAELSSFLTHEDAVSLADLQRFLDAPPEVLRRARERRDDFSDPVAHFCRILASTETYYRLALRAVERWRPQALFLFVEGTDTVAHLFASYAPPKRPQVDSEKYRWFHRAVETYYSYADSLLGELLAALGSDAEVILCSDHGFVWGDARPTVPSGPQTPTAAYWHREPGVLVISGPHAPHLTQRQRAHVLDLAPIVLALFGLPKGADWEGSVPAWLTPTLPPPPHAPLRWEDLVNYDLTKSTPNDSHDDEIVARLRSLGYLGGGSHAPEQVTTATLGELLNRAGSALERRDFAAAEKLLRQAVAAKPSLPGPWIKLAQALRLAGKLDEALTAAERALSLDGTEAHRELAYLEIALIFTAKGQLNDARRILTEAVGELPESFVLWNVLGGLELEQGNKVEAYKALKTATALREEPETLNTLAALEVELFGNRQEAVRLWRRSLALKPGQKDVEMFLVQASR